MADLSAAEAAGSPCTRYVWRGGAGRPVSQRSSSLFPACAENCLRLITSAAIGHILAMNAERLRAFFERPSARACGLEAGQQNGVSAVRRPLREVMQHASAGGHAAGRNDDGGSPDVVDLLGVLDGAHIVHGVRVERVSVVFFLGEDQIVVFVVAQVQAGDADGHRAIHKHGKVRNAVGVFQLADDVHDGLRAVHGERRDHDHAAALCDAIDDIRQRILGGIRWDVRGLRKSIRRATRRSVAALQDSSGLADRTGPHRRKTGQRSSCRFP